MIKYLSALFLLTFAINANTQCSTTVTVPADITLCNPDDVVLDGQINGPYLNFFWQGSNGYFNAQDLSPTVSVNQTTTFVFQSRSIPGPSDNLIVNGDFENGNTGFTSQYTFVGTPSPIALWNQGTYAITNNPKSYHQNFKPCTDHTSGSGDMMVVNGAATLSKVWCQTLTIMPNTIYVFQAWAASVENSSPAKLQFSMNGTLIGNIFNVNPTTCIWDDFYDLWDSGSNTSVEICITNQNFAQSGNDFALDDIYFAPTCISEDSVKVTVVDFTPSISGDKLLDCGNIQSTLIGEASPSNPQYIYDWSSANGSYTSGSNPNEIIVDREGIYTLTVIDENSCIRFTEYVVNEDFEPPVASLEVSDTIDCTHASALISVLISGKNKSFSWTGPNNFTSTDKDITVNTPGTYIVTIVNEVNHCDYTTAIEVIGAFDGPVFELLKDGSLTCSKDTVQLTSNVSGSGLTYLWTGNGINAARQNDSLITVKNKGIYSLKVTDQDGCFNIKKISVDSIAALINVSKLSQDVLSCNRPNVRLKEKFMGKVDSVLWQGPGGFKSNLISPLVNEIGKYSLVALDSNGCKAIDTVEIINNIEVPIPIFSTKEVDCISQKGNIIIQANDSLAFLVNLLTSEKLNFGLPYEYDKEGRYPFEVTAHNGCKDTFEVMLNKNVDFPISNILHNSINCANAEATVNVSSNLPSTYVWKNKSGYSSVDQNIVVSIPGRYYLTTTSALGCTVLDSIDIEMDTLKPLFGYALDQLSCQTKTVIPRLIAGDTTKWKIQWQGPQQFSSIEAFPSFKNKGRYTAAATGENGCISSVTYDILLDDRLPDAAINPEDLLNCKVFEIEKKYTSASSLTNAVWHTPTDTFMRKSIMVSSPGNYFLTGQHPVSGCKDTFNFTIKQDIRKPVATIVGTDTITCKNKVVERSIATSPVDAILLQWKQGEKTISSLKTVQFSSAGDFSVVYQHPQSLCKDSTQFVLFEDLTQPQIGLETSIITCLKSTATIKVSGQISHIFTFDKEVFTRINQYEYSTSKAGQYKLTAEGSNGCKSVMDFEIKEDKKKPVFTVSDGTVGCDLKPADIKITQDSGEYAFFVLIGGIEKEIIDNTVELLPGVYTCTATDSYNGCKASKEFSVTKIDNGPISVSCGLNFVCESKSYAYTINEVKSGTPPFNYYLDSVLVNLVAKAQPINSGTHLLKVIDANGCATSTQFDIEKVEGYTASLPLEIKINYGESTTLDVITSIDQNSIKKIEWVPSSGLSCDDCLSPLCTTLDNMLYKVIITDEHDCTTEARTSIKIDYTANVYYPSVFNPATNFFTLYGTDYTITEISELALYDRWGNSVFLRKSFPPNDVSYGWDGTLNAEEVLSGVYVFYAKVKTIKNEYILIHGDVTLVR